MPILRVKEIRDMSSEDRQKRLAELQTELVRLKTMIKAGGSIENPGRVPQLRKAIARISTIENEPKPVKKEEKKKERKKETKEQKKKAEKKPKEDKKE
jgi:large subunit ribosomal protein L29